MAQGEPVARWPAAYAPRARRREPALVRERGTRAVTIRWTVLAEGDPRWHARGCLYAYVAPDYREVLYIGLAGRRSVRERWVRSGKDDFWTDLERQRRIYKHQTLMGVIDNGGLRASRALAADLEAVLIAAMRPWGNVQKPPVRARAGLAIRNRGQWPGPRRIRTISAADFRESNARRTL